MTPEKHKENTIRAMLLEIKYFGELQEKENP